MLRAHRPPATPAAVIALPVVHLDRLPYREAYDRQLAAWQRVFDAREAAAPVPGELLLVEHDPPVITVSQRPSARDHLTAPPHLLAARGVTVEDTDRGGDITYHGPGQLVAYPILDLNHLGLRLHDYMRLLEQAVIDTLARFNITGERDPGATGVWVRDRSGSLAKVCAMGIRVKRWISLHGLALNVTTNLDHFNLIVPCGLARPVTSLHALLGDRCPTMQQVQLALVESLRTLLPTTR